MVERNPRIAGGGQADEEEQRDEFDQLEAPETQRDAQDAPDEIEDEALRREPPRTESETGSKQPTTQEDTSQQAAGTSQQPGSNVRVASGSQSIDPAATQPLDPVEQAETTASETTGSNVDAGSDLENSEVEVTESGSVVLRGDALTDAGAVTEAAKQQLAAESFDQQFPDVEITASDVERTDAGFTLGESGRRKVAAEQLEDDLQEDGVDIDLTGEDVRATDDGFTVTTAAKKKIAAEQFSEQTGADIEAEDTRVEASGSGVTVEDNIRVDDFEGGAVPEVDETVVLNEEGQSKVDIEFGARDVPELKQDRGQPLVGPSDPSGPGRTGEAPAVQQAEGDVFDSATQGRVSQRQANVIEERALSQINEQAEERFGVELTEADIDVSRKAGGFNTLTGEVENPSFDVTLTETGQEKIEAAAEEANRPQGFLGEVEATIDEGTEGLVAGSKDVIDFSTDKLFAGGGTVGLSSFRIAPEDSRFVEKIEGRQARDQPVLTFDEVEQFEPGGESFGEQVIERGTGAATIFFRGPQAVTGASKFVGKGLGAAGGDFAASTGVSPGLTSSRVVVDPTTERTSEFTSETAAAVNQSLQQVQEDFAEEPVLTSVGVAGSLVATGGATALARRASGTRAARAVEATFQPVESLAVGGLNRVAPAAVVSRIPGGRLDNEEIAIATGRKLGAGARSAAVRARRELGEVSAPRFDVNARTGSFLSDTRGQFEMAEVTKEVEVEEEVESELDEAEADAADAYGGISDIPGVEVVKEPSVETETEAQEDPLEGLTEMVEQDMGFTPEVTAEAELEAVLKRDIQAESEFQVTQESEFMDEGLDMAEATLEPESRQRLDQETEFRSEPLLETEIFVEREQTESVAVENLLDESVEQESLQSELTETDFESELEQELTQELEVEQELTQELETEVEAELDQELEIERELQAEVELEDELELETELEAELESELESESEVFPRDDKKRRDVGLDDVGAFDKVFERGVASAEDVLDLDESVGGQ